MLSRFHYCCALFAASLFACSVPSIDRFTPPEVDARSRDYLFQFTRGQVDSAVQRLVLPLRTPEAIAELQKIADVLHDQHFDTVRVIGASTNVVNNVRHVNLTYELHSRSSWFLANVATVDTANTWLVEGISARTLAQPLEIVTAFSLRGKSAVHYGWLIASISCVAFSLATAAFVATRRRMPKRWRWVVGSLIGVGAFRLNWATGVTSIALFQVQFLSASVLRAGTAAPWILSFAFPLGAVLALRRYRKWRLAPVQPASDLDQHPEAAV